MTTSGAASDNKAGIMTTQFSVDFDMPLPSPMIMND